MGYFCTKIHLLSPLKKKHIGKTFFLTTLIYVYYKKFTLTTPALQEFQLKAVITYMIVVRELRSRQNRKYEIFCFCFLSKQVEQYGLRYR